MLGAGHKSPQHLLPPLPAVADNRASTAGHAAAFNLLPPLPAVADNGAMEAKPPNIKPPNPSRRWYQFSLRTLLIAVMLLAAPLGYVGWQAKIVRERKAWKERLPPEGYLGSVPALDFVTVVNGDPNQSPSLIRRWLGDERIDAMQVPPDTFDASQWEELKSLFPETRIFANRAMMQRDSPRLLFPRMPIK